MLTDGGRKNSKGIVSTCIRPENNLASQDLVLFFSPVQKSNSEWRLVRSAASELLYKSGQVQNADTSASTIIGSNRGRDDPPLD